MNAPSSASMGRASSLTLLKYVVAVMMTGPIVTMVVLGQTLSDMRVNYVGPPVMLLVALSGWFFMARGQLQRATQVMAYGACLTVAGTALFTGGVRSPAMLIYPVVILIYGWLSNSTCAVRLTALVTLLSLGLFASESSGWLPRVAQVPSTLYLVHATIIYLLSALLIVFISRAYKQQMDELRHLGDKLASHSALLEQNTALLERAQNVAHVGSWTADLARGRVMPSAQGGEIMGMSARVDIGLVDYLKRVHHDDRHRVDLAWKKALVDGFFDVEHRIIIDGSTRWVRQKAELEFAPDGQPTSALGIVQDITERALIQQALKRSEERYRTLIEWTPEAILVHRHTRILYANPAALKLFGAADVASLARHTTTELIHPDSRQSQQARMHSIEAGEALPPTAEARFLKLDGSVIDVEVQGTAIEFDGEPALHVSIRDITERKRLEHEIRQLAFYDVLTHLPNRRLLNDRLGQALALNRRNGSFGALMFLDLDNFKPLNDLHGHAVGDLLLMEAAKRLKSCVRQIDTVARFGGDEFVVLLAELDTDATKSRLDALAVAEKIKASMAQPYTLTAPGESPSGPQIEHICTASIGVVVFPSTADTQPQELTKRADAAMYQAKNDGRNRICLSEPPVSQLPR